MEEVVEEAAVAAEGEGVTTSPEIQDAEPIRSAPMTEATASRRRWLSTLRRSARPSSG
jgi:hypothetical protein